MSSFPGEIPPALSLEYLDELVTAMRAVEAQLGPDHFLISSVSSVLSPENNEFGDTRPTFSEVINSTHGFAQNRFPLVSHHVFRGSEVRAIYDALYLQADQPKDVGEKTEGAKWVIDSARYMLGRYGTELALKHSDHDNKLPLAATVTAQPHEHRPHRSEEERQQEQRFMSPERIVELNQMIADVPHLALMLNESQLRALTGEAAELAQPLIEQRWLQHVEDIPVTQTGVFTIQ